MRSHYASENIANYGNIDPDIFSTSTTSVYRKVRLETLNVRQSHEINRLTKKLLSSVNSSSS